MSRPAALLLLLAAIPLAAQDQASKPSTDPKQPELKRERTAPKPAEQEAIPPEEDTSLSKDDFSFNPLQSKRDVDVGDQYRKKGNYVAAARRYQVATLRNEGNAEAWYKLGEARAKLKDNKAALEAYNKYLELDPSSKRAQEVRKTVTHLK